MFRYKSNITDRPKNAQLSRADTDKKIDEVLVGDHSWLVGWLIGFNGISTSIGYLMPKPVYTYVRFVDT